MADVDRGLQRSVARNRASLLGERGAFKGRSLSGVRQLALDQVADSRLIGV